jgi:ABC-2 type transport system ATP-binding protein
LTTVNDILEIDQISKEYAGHKALHDVSFGVREQSIFGLLGPNGAGKTSLIRIINQITAPDSGRILLNGKEISISDEARIGYLPEERGLYKKMKVGEQALYLSRLKGLDRKEAMKRLKIWFEKFEISGWWDKKIEELSKGMQQKVQFIVTVLHEPELLILDEPFSGFDPINATLIKNEILALRDKGTTVILSTHNMSSVEEICDDIALIYNSRKILDGPVYDVKQARKDNTFRITYHGDPIAFTKALWIDAELLQKSNGGSINWAEIRLLNGKKPNDLLTALIPHVEIHALEEKIPSMNDVFIQRVTEINEKTHE